MQVNKGASDKSDRATAVEPVPVSPLRDGIPSADEWRYCGAERGGCSCMMVWSTAGDAPVCTVERGEWGDEYPALRFVEDSGGRQVEAYQERMGYGFIPDEIAKANAYLIAAAPALFRACRDWLSAWGDEAAEVVAIRQMEEAVLLAQAGVTRMGGDACGSGAEGPSTRSGTDAPHD